MEFILIATLSMTMIYAAQTVSFSSNANRPSYAIGHVEREDRPSGTKTIDRKDFDFFIDNVQEFESQKPDSAEDLWSENFETAYVLMETKRKQQLFDQAVEILRYPFGTSDQQQPDSTPEQYEKIRIRVETSSSVIVPQDDIEYNSKPAVADSISNSIPEEFPTNSDPNDLIVTLKDIVQNPTTQHGIHSRKNPTQATSIDVDDLTNSVHQMRPNLSPEMEQNLVDSVTRYVTEKITRVIEEEIQPQLETSNSPPIDHLTVVPFQSVDYTVPGIDRNLIENLQGPVDQTWQGPDHDVRFKRNFPAGDVELWWNKGNDKIYLHSFPNGAADQNWSFGDVHIGLFRDEDSNLIQVWSFGNTTLEYIKNRNDESSPSRRWEFGNKDEASYWKYRHLIKLWCNANDFYVGKESCVIY